MLGNAADPYSPLENLRDFSGLLLIAHLGSLNQIDVIALPKRATHGS